MTLQEIESKIVETYINLIRINTVHESKLVWHSDTYKDSGEYKINKIHIRHLENEISSYKQLYHNITMLNQLQHEIKAL